MDEMYGKKRQMEMKDDMDEMMIKNHMKLKDEKMMKSNWRTSKKKKLKRVVLELTKGKRWIKFWTQEKVLINQEQFQTRIFTKKMNESKRVEKESSTI